MTPLTRRSLLVGGLAATTAGLLAACSPVRPTPTPAPTSAGRAFLSGASCIGAANGDFGRWRGEAVAVASTWVTDGVLTAFDAEWGRWRGDLDFAPQYSFADQGGFSWAALAKGRYDARIARDLRALRTTWGDRKGSLHYRFQHEFNGTWYPWAADDASAKDFVAGWRHFAELFRATLQQDPRFRIVWCPSGGAVNPKLRDVRALWPGDDVVDVVGVDFYDFAKPRNPFEWQVATQAVDAGGGPKGLDAWQRFAAQHGKPIALPEWGNQYGDNAFFIEQMHDFITQRPADTPTDGGKVLYEVYFNQRLDGGTPSTEGDFRLQQSGKDSPLRPIAAERYRSLWNGRATS